MATINPNVVSVDKSGCDLDGDIFYYNGKPVYINLKAIWLEGYRAATYQPVENSGNTEYDKLMEEIWNCFKDKIKEDLK